MPSAFPDYYADLRVGPDASQEELRRAWRAAAKRWHPDTNGGAEAQAMKRRVNEAWQVLGDHDARTLYDEIYYTWRASSETMSEALREGLRLQEARRRARETAGEWARWGAEDRRGWERAEEGRPENPGQRTSASRSGSHDKSPTDPDDDSPEETADSVAWALGFAAIVVVVIIAVAIFGAISS